uniref:ADP-ribosyltransferase exoenzyme domain protein n=1 Tax=Mimivirus LCMiAC02 TaxID=2506609 RepID=A0A481Z0X4_9VIRU|nr:MAG: uncharacterized protein LCMiAC02_02570 [Mimivirus LCMiAC02]
MHILYYKKKGILKIAQHDKVIDDLYNQYAVIPSKKHIEEYDNSDNKIKKFFANNTINEAIDKIKKSISKIDNKIPLYHEPSKNLYIINKKDVYNRVIYHHYRFLTDQLIKILKKRKDKMKKKGFNNNIFAKRAYDKAKLALKFIKSFDIKTLYNTYIKVFYEYGANKNLTICIRPSFKPHFHHINPYYTRSELINMALNMEKIKESKIYYDDTKLMKLCDIIKKNDINASTILEHQIHIIMSNKIGIVQYYSLQGSYFMNNYMRQLVPYKYKNTFMEKNIRSMWKLINNAPAFDKSYILYRFIQSDPHLKHLKIGDKYLTQSFISSTRDPFYLSDEYKFGLILIKIKIQKKIEGVALCIETISHFPKEEEIILSPLSILRLDKKDDNVSYYHTDDIHESKINTRYEFTYIGKKSIKFIDRPIYKNNNIIDFLKLDKEDALSMDERIKFFLYKYTTPLNQYKTRIGKNVYTVITEWYDSTDVYKKFYSTLTENGFIMYMLIDNYMEFTIEIGEDNVEPPELGRIPYMYVNYYFKHSQTNKKKYYTDDEFLEFISKIAYYFEIDNILLYANYSSCDFNNDTLINKKRKKEYYGGNYCTDFYEYLKFGKKSYDNIDTTIIKPKFSYYQLNRLKKINPMNILSHHNKNELYQIYKQAYKINILPKNDNFGDFYVWLVDNYCIFLKNLIKILNDVYVHVKNNPFKYDYYILKPISYLYNNGLIEQFPIFGKKSKMINTTNIDINRSKNMYRINRKIKVNT